MDDLKPRSHHYIFAHVALPQLFYSDPALFTATLARDGDRFMLHLWEHVWKNITVPVEMLDSTGLKGEVCLLAHHVQASLITLPAPLRVAEAYFVAALFSPDFKGAPLARYYTLEYGWNILTNTAYTVFCGWTAAPNRVHFNKGAGPDPDLDAFLSVVQADIDRQPPSPPQESRP